MARIIAPKLNNETQRLVWIRNALTRNLSIKVNKSVYAAKHIHTDFANDTKH